MARILRSLSALSLWLVLLCAGAAWADPPSRVGRLSLIDGDVSLRPADSRHWEDASTNWPLTSGDALETNRGGRAEIRVGSSVLRLDGSTTIDIRQLDDERIRILLERGSVALRVRSREPSAAIEIETRDGLVVADEPGQYRVDYEDATTTLTNYRGGDLEFHAEDGDVVVTEGRAAHITYTNRTEVRWDDPDRDDFADWTLARDARDDRIGRTRYVSPEMTGAEDLYEYGDWRDSHDYGPVWYPRSVPYGWAPYRSGRWVSVQPWGWTWIDEAPWGFAPFHYGRWVLIRGVWAWVPGAYVARPIYAPALVVWIGVPGVSINLTSGPLPSVGWFPLAPREVYVPSYRHSPTYVRQINITHVTNVVNITRIVEEPRRARYTYRDRREAVTVVPGDVLRLSRPVQRDAMRDIERNWQEKHTVTPVPPIDPRLVAERNRRERAGQPKDEDRLRDEQIRRSERLREAVDERRRRERAGEARLPAGQLREAPERDTGGVNELGRRLDDERDSGRRRDGPQGPADAERDRVQGGSQRKQIPEPPQRQQMLELQQRQRQQQIQQEQERAVREREPQERTNERQDPRQRLQDVQQERQRAQDAQERRQQIESQERERQQQDGRQREREGQEERMRQQQRQQQQLQSQERQQQELLQRQQRERERQEERTQQQQQQQSQERERQQQEQLQRQQRERERLQEREQQLRQQQLQQSQERERQQRQEQSQRERQQEREQQLRQQQQQQQSQDRERQLQQRERERQQERMQQIQQQQERARIEAEQRNRAQQQEAARSAPQNVERGGRREAEGGQRGQPAGGEQGQGKNRRIIDEARPDN